MKQAAPKTFPVKNIALTILWGVLITIYLATPLRHLDAYAWDYDEGPYLQAAALAAQGYPLYAEVVLNKLPFLTWLLQASFTLGGLTLTTARFTLLMTTLLGFVCLGLLAELWWGKGAGPATMALFLLIPESLVRAAVVMNDLPAMSLALASLVAATLFRHNTTRRRRACWLVASATAFALTAGTHPLLFFTAAPILWTLIAPQRRACGRPSIDVREAVRIVVIFGSTGAVLLGATLALVDIAGFTRWVYEYNTVAAHNAGQSPTWSPIVDYLRAHGVLLALAASSLIPLTTARRRWLSVALVWAVTTLTALYVYRPLWEHYLIFLLYPLVIIAGGGIAVCIAQVTQRKLRHPRLTWSTSLVMLGLIIGSVSQDALVPVWPRQPNGHEAAYAYLREEIQPGDFIATDNQFFAFTHGYPVPPSLADTSFKRITNGFLHIGDVVEAVQTHAVRFLVLDFDRGRFYHFPHFMQGIEAIAATPRCFDTLCIYRVRPYQQVENTLGEGVRLTGYTMSEISPLHAGGTFTVTLYWKSLAPVSGDLSVFVHVRDAESALVAQHDGVPLLGSAPPSGWQPGMIIPDPHPVVLGPDVIPGPYTITVGMYHWPTLKRVPAIDKNGSRWQDDAIILTPLKKPGF